MYKITLFDYNCTTYTSGVAVYYTQDIEDFTEKWLKLEGDDNRKDRFMRSKNGEIVTDYYSDDPELNIVQKDDSCVIYHDKSIEIKDRWITLYNGYNWPSNLHFAELKVNIQYIKYHGEHLKIATYTAEGVCTENDFGLNEDAKYHNTHCYGNPVLINDESGYQSSSNTNEFSNTIEFIAYLCINTFNNLDELNDDYNNKGISEEELQVLLSDIVGDAG